MLQDLPLAKKLILLRGDRGLREVARGADIAASTLCRMEQGVHDQARSRQSSTLRGETLRRLANYYGVLPEYLTRDMKAYMRAWATAALTDPSLPSSGARVRRTLEELERRYGVDLVTVARAIGMEAPDLQDCATEQILVSETVASALEEETGVPAALLLSRAPAERQNTVAYDRLVSLAVKEGVPPETLEELLRTWLAKNRQTK